MKLFIPRQCEGRQKAAGAAAHLGIRPALPVYVRWVPPAFLDHIKAAVRRALKKENRM